MSEAGGAGRPRPGARRGPRREGDARADILAAARRLFAERGYDGTSLRAVARAASVDPALVHHYFAGKPDLYSTTIGLGVDPAAVRDRVLAAGRSGGADVLVRTFLSLWDGPEGEERMRGLLVGLATRSPVGLAYREFVAEAILGPLMAEFAADQPARRGALVSSQLVGLAVVRYVVRMEPLAGAPVEEVVALVAPTLRRYLEDPLPAP
ncbi:MAG: TetR family transcriptional regulator [Kineosporiaceae bacterium]